MDIFSAIHDIIDPEALISAFGLFGVIGIVFLETGFFFGFFFPGDSLLFTAGLLVSTGHLSVTVNPIWSLIILAGGTFIAAVAGDSVGYAFGKKIGPAIFTKDDSIFFNRKHIARAQHFYERYGVKTIIIARFMPLIRTFAPIVAGIGNMRYRTFLTYNVIGGFIWTVGMTSLGFGFGSIIPNPDRYLLPVIVLIIFTSILPGVWEILRKKKIDEGGVEK